MKRIHFTGIGGAGMAPLAELTLAKKCLVSGSDESDSAKILHLKESGAEVYTGHRAENLPDNASLLVYSSAVPENNCERKKAAALNIPQIRRGGYLAELAKSYRRCVSVTGTHGKSSITAALVMILRKCGYDPGFIIGAEVAGLPSCAPGDGDIFVTEADESDGTHTLLENFLAVIPNIEDDHEWSLGGAEKLDENFRIVARNSCNILYYSSKKCSELFCDHPAAVILQDIPEKFALLHGFQASNARIAAEAAVLLGCDRAMAYQAAEDYPQVLRRMTLHRNSENLVVIEDYAHHPTEVRAALELLRKNYPDAHLRVLFQPHRFARLEKYFNEFAEVLHLADSVFIAPVFAAWSETGSVNAADLAAAAGGIAAVGTFREQAETVKADLPEGKNVIAVLGAGDVNKVIEFL
ncbi:MAG: hypothetical protein J6W00_11945 [Lentisphaeria bacterium]|nr:hypothetical protein [Lentisphaeria bacterium]